MCYGTVTMAEIVNHTDLGLERLVVESAVNQYNFS